MDEIIIQDKTPHGTFTQVPNVFFDTCDLPETAQILYLRLYRHIGHLNCKFTGSIRKLSKLVRMSKSTVCRMIKKLAEAKLIKIDHTDSEEENKDIMVITLYKDDLWSLNVQHCKIEAVPNWDKEMPVVTNIPNECPNLGHDVPDLGQHDINLGHDVPDLGHDVPDLGHDVPAASSKSTTIRSNTIKTSKTKNIVTSRVFPDECLEKVTELSQDWDTAENVESHIHTAEEMYTASDLPPGTFLDAIYFAMSTAGRPKDTYITKSRYSSRMELFFEVLREALANEEALLLEAVCV